MLKSLIYVLLLSLSAAYAQSQAGWGVNLSDEKGSEKSLRIGGRLQALLTSKSSEESQDYGLRRVRFNILYKPKKDYVINFDIRNDEANLNDKGERKFLIGDAYLEVSTPQYKYIDNFRFFRAKVDVSYTQTSSSKNLFNPQRAQVAEFASDFIVQNRRAANAQINGHVGKLNYHAVIADGVHSQDFREPINNGNELDSIAYQKLTYGAKLRYYFRGDAKKNPIQDTYYGTGDVISLGVGHFRNDSITFELSNGSQVSHARDLTNVELSVAQGAWRFLSEYFLFNGSVIDFSQSAKKDIFGRSSGYYAQTEYVFNKWAPFISLEYFDQWDEKDHYAQVSKVFGVNYYENFEAQRYGIAYRKDSFENNIGDRIEEKIFLYAMFNF